VDSMVSVGLYLAEVSPAGLVDCIVSVGLYRAAAGLVDWMVSVGLYLGPGDTSSVGLYLIERGL